MDTSITIQQLAQIFAISQHQIRHYEEKGLLLPAYIADNGYRRYTVTEIYQLAQILLLRDLHLSLAEIKQIMTEYQQADYLRLLRAKCQELEAEMKKLQQIKATMEHYIAGMETKKTDAVRYCEQRHLKKVITLSLTEALTAQDFLRMKLTFTKQFFHQDMIYVFEEAAYHICLQSETPADLVLAAGEYCSRWLRGKSDAEFEKQLQPLLAKGVFPFYAIEGTGGIFSNNDSLEWEILIPREVEAG